MLAGKGEKIRASPAGITPFKRSVLSFGT